MATEITNGDKIVYVKARAFTGDQIRLHKCIVEPDGTVRVWDDVAGHFTTLHILSKGAVARCRKAEHNSVASPAPSAPKRLEPTNFF